jgi:hypothetical protein
MKKTATPAQQGWRRRCAALALLLLGLALAACGGGTPAAPEPPVKPDPLPDPALELLASGVNAVLPSVQQLAARKCSGERTLLFGADYSADLAANRVTRGQFAPAAVSYLGLPGCAYAVYELRLAAAKPNPTLELKVVGDAAADNAWLGLLDFTQGRGTWQRFPAVDQGLARLTLDAARYINSADSSAWRCSSRPVRAGGWSGCGSPAPRAGSPRRSTSAWAAPAGPATVPG